MLFRNDGKRGCDMDEREKNSISVEDSGNPRENRRADLVIEEMTPEDIPEVAELERQVFSAPWSEAGFLSSLRSPDTLYLVVRQEGRLVGYCGFLRSFDEADVMNVAVAPEFRNAGIGQRMLRELMSRGRARGVLRYTLEVRQSNAAAIHLYEKLGFAAVGVRKDFYEKPVESAVIMWTAQME